MRPKKTNILLLVALAALLTACGPGKVKVKGTFTGFGHRSVYLDLVTPRGNTVVDSARTDAKGRFRLAYRPKSQDPVFLNVRLGDGQYIALLASPGERVKLSSLCNISMNYRVEGSEDSERVRQLNISMARAYHSIDSLQKALAAAGDSLAREINREMSRIYIRQKQDNIKFVVRNATSLAAVMALYQRMPNGLVIFGDPSDLQYYVLVADSLAGRYPASPHVQILQADVREALNARDVRDRIVATVGRGETAEYPDLVLNDMLGKPRRLSDYKGKVVLLTFWSAATGNSNLLNRELVELYGRDRDKGFEIYQVSLDTSKPEWVNALQEQKLPWVNVCDFNGFDSYAARVYNVGGVPANYLIDREGRLVGKNLWGEELARKVESLL